MATVAEGGVGDDFAGGGAEGGEDLGDHDRDVGAGGRATRGADVGLDIGIFVGSALLVALVETARVGAGVARAAAGRWAGGFVARGFGHGGILGEGNREQGSVKG